MRSKRALINTIFSLILQIATFVSGMLIPRMIIVKYGSDVNGLVTSITQFLGYLTLLEAGIGGVIKAELYQPLAGKDEKRMSMVMKASETFFHKIAYISIAYIVILSVLYPVLINDEFQIIYTAVLVIIIGVGTVAQYYFGITYQLLLQADQKGYIYYFFQTCAIILNVVISMVLIYAGFSIQIVKLVSSTIFVARPIIINIYVKKHYKIHKDVENNGEVLKQRWNGMAHSLAAFVHKKADVFLLSTFSTLSMVSIYSVYTAVTYGLNAIVTVITNPFQAAFGDMIAKGEKKTLERTFRVYIWLSNEVVITVFSVAIIMILPFIELYTKGVEDVNYYRPVFSVLILLAEMFFCLRQPYQAVITAAGHYKQTQRGGIIEAVMNIVISFIFLYFWGLTGVALGTLISMLYRTFDYALYLRKNIIEYPLTEFFKRMAISAASLLCCVFLKGFVGKIQMESYLAWSLVSCGVMLICFIICTVFNILFYKEDLEHIIQLLKGLKKKKK